MLTRKKDKKNILIIFLLHYKFQIICNATEEYDYINESIIDNNINIYPNPAENEIHISSEDRIEEVTIYNVNGQQTIVNGQQSTSESIINISSLNAGVYFIKIKTDNQIITKPFIKK